MKAKDLLAILCFFVINQGLWEVLVSSFGLGPQWASFYVYLVLMVIVSLAYWKEIGRSFKTMQADLAKPGFLLKRIVLPMAMAYGGLVLLSNLMALAFNLDIIPDNTENIREIQETLPLALSFIMMTILAPVIEEVVFRKAFLSWIPKSKKSLVRTMALASVLVFAAIHVDIWTAGKLGQVLYYIPLSLALVYIYLYNDRQIAASITAHAITNLFGFFLILLGMI